MFSFRNSSTDILVNEKNRTPETAAFLLKQKIRGGKSDGMAWFRASKMLAIKIFGTIALSANEDESAIKPI